MWLWFTFILIQRIQSECDNLPIDLNTAAVSELTSLPYVSSSSAELIAKFRPLCSPRDLTSSPKKINGITESRLNTHWKWHSDKSCSDTCCLADASCPSHADTTNPTSSSLAVYSWHATPWSHCSAPCNTGSQSREVTCFNSTDTVPNALCLFVDEEPLKKQLCNTQRCPNYRWIPHSWNTCHSVNDQCMQTRDIVCYDTVDNTVQSDIKCGTKVTSHDPIIRLCDIAKCDTNPLPVTGGSVLAVEDMDTSVEMDTDHDTAGDDRPVDRSTISIQLDLKQQYNHDQCHTSLYTKVDDNALITRRGCPIIIDLKFSGLNDISIVDASWFTLRVEPALSDESDDSNPWDSADSFNARIAYKAGQLTVDIPNNAQISKYKYTLSLKGASSASESAEPTFMVFVLFNPYSTEDDVYMRSEVDRAEYVENDVGLVWTGSSQYNQARHWIYGQYQFKNLEVAMRLIHKLPYLYRNDTVLVARFITYAVGKYICRGNWGSGSMTTGHPWGGYQCDETKHTCHAPGDWTGTAMMLDVYREVFAATGEYYPVQYCQCWVFAGATTTVGRALGIPTRSVTNFQSAHDTNFNRGIETYFILDEEKKTYKSTDGKVPDSVWNFHVWNEMYFKRNDFKNAEYNTEGWQVVDATPQEQSYGGNPVLTGILYDDDASDYQLGPAAKDQIKNDMNPNECTHAPKHRKRFGCFDNEFVISEVNANFNMWVKSSASDKAEFNLTGSYMTNPFDPEATIGQHMSTKKPTGTISDACLNEVIMDCSLDRLDVTSEYKQSEPSSPGMPTNTTYYHTVGDSGYRRRLWTDNEMDADWDESGIDYVIEWKPKQWYVSPMLVADDKDAIIELYGTDSTFGMMSIDIDSYFDHSVLVYCSFFITAHNYRGMRIINDTVKEKHDWFELDAGEGRNCLFHVNYTDYSWIMEQHSSVEYFKFLLSVSIYDGIVPYQSVIQQRNVLVCTPQYYLSDRVVCDQNGLQWLAPSHHAEYNCSAEYGIDMKSVGDGYCDALNNRGTCYDGGDCCETSCIPSDDYFCESFDCVDPRLSSLRGKYMDCPQALSFIDYMNDLATAAVCVELDHSILQAKMDCSDVVWTGNTGNRCLNQVYAADGVFGAIDACYDQTLHSVPSEMQQIIEFVVDCMDHRHSDTTTTVVLKAHEVGADKRVETPIGITLVALSCVFILVLVAVGYYLFSRRKEAKAPLDSPFLQLNEQDVNL